MLDGLSENKENLCMNPNVSTSGFSLSDKKREPLTDITLRFIADCTEKESRKFMSARKV